MSIAAPDPSVPPQIAARAGLFGKLPARGDFVRDNLPGDFVAPWDAWLQACVAASRAELGDAWLACWLAAPVWRFRLAPGLCGAAAVLGLLLPSVDRVGRYFPLTLAAVAPPDGIGEQEGDTWLDAAEAAGLAALEQDATPGQVAALLPPPPPIPPTDGSQWWSAGGPHVAASRRAYPGLPDPARFAALLRDPAPAP
jgi:type VI secretion system protein ImpM